MNKDAKVSILLDLYGGILSEIQFKSIDLYYNQDFSLSEISYHTGKSRQGVFDSIKRSEAILNKMESSLGFYEKMCKISKVLNEISEVSSEIENSEALSQIKSKATQIKKLANSLNYKI